MLTGNTLAMSYTRKLTDRGQEYGAYTQSQLESDVNTDWIKETTRTGVVHSHNLQVQGGNENTKILTSIGYFDQAGVLKNTDYSRFSGRVNVDQKINSFIKSGVSLYGQRANSNIQDYGGNILQSNVLLGILTYDPTVPAYNADGSFGRPPGGRGDNPLANLVARQNEVVQDRLNGNAYLEIKPIQDLTARVNGGVGWHYTGKCCKVPVVVLIMALPAPLIILQPVNCLTRHLRMTKHLMMYIHSVCWEDMRMKKLI